MRKPRKARSRDGQLTLFSTSSSGTPKWRQSPIDLNRINTWAEKCPPLSLCDYWMKKGAATMSNTGRTVSIELSNRALPCISGGPLGKDEFEFMNVEFRWGPSDARGAEHSVNNTWYSMEVQIMHWNIRYESVEKCYEKPDGIVILSYFMQVFGNAEAEDNQLVKPITDKLPKIRVAESETEITSDCLLWMVEPSSDPGYYTYPGSLTRPPYNECVIWIIVPRAIPISSRQMKMFRSLYDYKAKDEGTIDLDDEKVHRKRYPPLILNGHWLNDGKATLLNSGLNAEILLHGDRIPSVIHGGPLGNDQYEFYEAHLHWSEENCRGAQHTINGSWFSMECHVVHWNRKYPSYEESLNHKDGISVLAYLFLAQSGIDNEENHRLDGITRNLKHIRTAGAEVGIPANSLAWLRLATHCPNYYVYRGSYSERNYLDCATWIVFPLIVPIHARQIEEFRKLTGEEGKPLIPKCRNIKTLKSTRIFLATS